MDARRPHGFPRPGLEEAENQLVVREEQGAEARRRPVPGGPIEGIANFAFGDAGPEAFRRVEHPARIARRCPKPVPKTSSGLGRSAAATETPRRRMATNQQIEFRVLGPLAVRIGGRAVAAGGPKQRALLALLLLSANRVVARERLIGELFPEQSVNSADR